MFLLSLYTKEFQKCTKEEEEEVSPLECPPCPPCTSIEDNSSLFASTSEENQVDSSENEMPPRDFYEIGARWGTTDKVRGVSLMETCQADRSHCVSPEAQNPHCRVGHNHFYHTIYNRWLEMYARNDAEPFQFLEIGYFQGGGFDVYSEFLSAGELHSMEIACIEEGPREEGKWPWGNFAAKNARYQELLDADRLHCGDASDFAFLNQTWIESMKRTDAPPLRIVVDDAAHLATHMAASLFFWFPRIEPGGLLIIEDIQPISLSNDFRIHVLPQLVKDLHYCGLDEELVDKACFPTIQPLLHSIHCEMHICILERNNEPAWEPNETESSTPKGAFDVTSCLLGSKR